MLGDHLNSLLGLALLDAKLGGNPVIAAFPPMRLVVAGGFFAVAHLKNRQSTQDLDYLLDPELATNEDVRGTIRSAVKEVAEELGYTRDWANEDIAVFVTKKATEQLMKNAIQQDIVLWVGQNIRVLAAPVEWALERKLRRIYAVDRGRKSELDMSDALAMLRFLRDKNGGKLDMEYHRRLNVNGFDVVPDRRTMHSVAAAYRAKYSEDIFL